jgi:hypothetical protein
MSLPSLYVQGMGGIGDCLHQRSVLRQLMQRYAVTLMTPWPSMYHDLIAEGLIVVRRGVQLRTQMKNEQREADKFASRHPLTQSSAGMRIAYGGGQVTQTESKTVLEAMCHVTGTDYLTADYRLAVPDAWTHELVATLGDLPARANERPWLVYRPLVARPEWRGSIVRNADPTAYAKLFQILRDTFFVVSVADLEEGREWLAHGPQLKADLTFHAGELTFEMLAALFKRADLVYTSSGFGAILGPAVGTPTISVIGGYESIGCHDSGARFAPYLAIGPRVECACWTSACRKACDKSIDMDAADDRIRKFLSQICIQTSDNTTSFEDMFTTPPLTVDPAVQQHQYTQQQRVLAMAMNRGMRA